MLKPSKDGESAPLGVKTVSFGSRAWTSASSPFSMFASSSTTASGCVPAPYVNLMAAALIAVRDGRQKRLIFNLPPGHMKSLAVLGASSLGSCGMKPAKRVPLHQLRGRPDAPVVAFDAARDDIQRLYRSNLPPDEVLAKLAEDLLTTTKGRQRLATAVGGAIAGFRAELTIIDDPMQPDEVAFGAQEAEPSRLVFRRRRSSRLVPGGAMRVVMHQLAPEYFTATLLEKAGWLHVSLPLIAVQEITYKFAPVATLGLASRAIR